MLGANDGIISTASLIVGVAAAAATQNECLNRGCRGTGGWRDVDGRGEYVSGSSQSEPNSLISRANGRS